MKSSAQLSLFELDPSSAARLISSSALGPLAVPDPQLVQLSAKIPSFIRLGTSSWTFRGWQGHVFRRYYPNERMFVRHSLEEYTHFPLFRTVGIDRSFWAPVAEGDLTRYAQQMPADFPCVMKVWDEITTVSYPSHPRFGPKAGQLNPNFLDLDAFNSLVVGPARRALGPRVAAYLLEIPPPTRLPNRQAFERALERFLSRVPADVHCAIELRDRRLLTRRHLDLVRANGASHVFNFWSRMPDLGAQLELAQGPVGPLCVARLMLPPGTSYEERLEAFQPFDCLKQVQNQMRTHVIALAERCRERGVELQVLVGNKAEGSSPWTVRALAELLAQHFCESSLR